MRPLSFRGESRRFGMALGIEVGVVVLAAGKGTRMKSDRAKVLHPVNGQSMIIHVVDCAVKVSGSNVVVVVGHQAEQVKAEVARAYQVAFAVQKSLLGTGDAVKAAIPHLAKAVGHVVVLCGDVPLIRAKTVEKLVDFHLNNENRLTALAVKVDEPAGYGRMILDAQSKLMSICEEADASMEEKKISLVNSGIYCIERQFLISALNRLNRDNAQNEYYLTDLVKIGAADGVKMGVLTAEDPREVLGVNTLVQLKKADVLCRERADV
ncbi:predicted nucleoside-diphosphate-sugar pyrophosphorylase [Desulforapulum autotrophicum HRM2]|uniref:Predicted nucleoside-diphosphate-sugar pyrophosphorylase n=2 Tax=Desulforapulum autotrophicum TaxID=2296 RepID=C0Q976_DESAH|nr:predicted nucleoside-diphosphate-sugar pyrophosphorylase [Desulforapulum autotrophicum HRM2]